MSEMRLIDANALMSQAFSTLQGYDAVLVEDIVNAPTVDAEPVKHGHWSQLATFLICSECKTTSKYQYPYCPNCGAKMDGGVEDEH